MMKDLWEESEGYLKVITNFGTSQKELSTESKNKLIELNLTMCATQLQTNVYVNLN